MQYGAYEALVAPARAKSAVWRLAIGLGMATAIYLGFIAALFFLLVAISGWSGAQVWLVHMATADSPTATLLVLATFVGMGIGPMVAAWLMHARPLWSLFGRRARLMRDFALAAGICAAIYAINALLPSTVTPALNLPTGLWAAFLPLALVAVLIQTGAEEVLFRGYFQTQLAARYAAPIVWMVVPAAVFAMLHFQPETYGQNAWLVICAIFLFALMAADLTAQTGTIGAAWGFHFANNCTAILLVGIDGPLSGLALFTLPPSIVTQADFGWLIARDAVVMVIVWAAIRLVLARRQA